MSSTAEAQVKQKLVVKKLRSHRRPGGGHVVDSRGTSQTETSREKNYVHTEDLEVVMSSTVEAQVKQKPGVKKIVSYRRPGGGHVVDSRSTSQTETSREKTTFTQKTWRWSCRRQPSHKSNRNKS